MRRSKYDVIRSGGQVFRRSVQPQEKREQGMSFLVSHGPGLCLLTIGVVMCIVKFSSWPEPTRNPSNRIVKMEVEMRDFDFHIQHVYDMNGVPFLFSQQTNPPDSNTYGTIQRESD